MGLSAGGFFKNFVKGAAQQYNANIAFEKAQEAEEERAKKKEKRQFGYDTKLKAMDLATREKIEEIKSEGKKKNLLTIALPNTGSTLNVPNTIDGKELSLTNLDNFTKNKNLYEALKIRLNKLPKTSIDLYRKNGDINVIANIVADRWYQQLPTSERKDQYNNTQTVVTLETTDWNYLSSVPEFQESAAKKLGTTVKLLQQRAIDMGDYVVDSSMEMTPNADGSKLEVTLADVVPAKHNLQTSHIDILKKQAPRFNKYDPREKVKIAPLVQEIDNVLKFRENQPIEGQVTMIEMVEAVGAATPILSKMIDPKRLDYNSMQKLKYQLEKNDNIDPYIYTDVDLLGKVISLSLPKKFQSKKAIVFTRGEQVELGSERIVQSIIGNKKAMQGVALKARLAADLEKDALSIETLVKSGAKVGFATTPTEIQNIISVGADVVKEGMGLIVQAASDNLINSKFVFQKLFGEAAKDLEESSKSTNEQTRKNGLLNFYATTMAFRMAAQIQNTGDTGSGPRISDDDVKRIATGLSQQFIQNDNKLIAVARAVRLQAEREKKIYQMYRSSKIHDIVTASILEDMYQGSISQAVLEVTADGSTSGVNIAGTYGGSLDKKINVITNDEKDKVVNPSPRENKNLFPKTTF